MRLIDADELKKRLSLLRCNDYRDAMLAVNVAPTIEGQEVIRCRECEYRIWDDFDGAYVCMKLGKFTKRDFWCAYGERRKRNAETKGD